MKICLFFIIMLLSICTNAEGIMQFSVKPMNKLEAIVHQLNPNIQDEIYADGDIDPMASERFEQFINAHSFDSNKTIVIFNSLGGSLLSGIKLGKVIRNNNFDTGIGILGKDWQRPTNGVCASACAYAFAGGNWRYFDDKSEMLGIHQFFDTENENIGNIGETQIISSLIVNYLREMGVDPYTFALASKTSSNEMLWLNVGQASKLGLVNNGVKPTTYEIKLMGLSPYIKIEQIRKDVGTRVLLYCDTGKLVMEAGIVTTPEASAEHMRSINRSYIETTSNPHLLDIKSNQNVTASGHVVWLIRVLDNSEFLSIANSEKIGIWTENGGVLKWGAILDIKPIRKKLMAFKNSVNGCKSTPK